MIRAGLAFLLGLVLTFGAAEAQAPKDSRAEPARLLEANEIIKVLPGRWQYRTDDGWKTNSNVSKEILCDESAERIWFERDAQGLVYYSQSGDSPKSRSRVGFDWFLFVQRPVIRVQYDGERRKDANGRPVAWELFMPDRDTFYWHRIDWPLGATTAPVRRCKDEVIS